MSGGGQVCVLEQNKRNREQINKRNKIYYEKHREEITRKENDRQKRRTLIVKQVREKLDTLEHCDMAEILFAGIKR
jgi:hypothetical protein